MWAIFYVWEGCLPDVESAFYFSGVTYATIGYGDLVLIEALANARSDRRRDRHPDVRLSAGVFFAAVNRIYAPRPQEKKGDVENRPKINHERQIKTFVAMQDVITGGRNYFLPFATNPKGKGPQPSRLPCSSHPMISDARGYDADHRRMHFSQIKPKHGGPVKRCPARMW